MANELTISPITANGTVSWTPSKTALYHLAVGGGTSDDFDSGDVTVSQNNVTLTGFNAASTAVANMVYLMAGVAVNFVTANVASASEITVRADLDLSNFGRR